MMARRSCRVGFDQSSFSRRIRPSAPISTTTASIGSTYRRIAASRQWTEADSDTRSGRCPHRVLDTENDGGGRCPVRPTAIYVFHVHVCVADKPEDRKSTRLNSSHQIISYAVFCLKKKKTHI